VSSEAPSAAPPATDRASLGLPELAKAILARTFKPRVGEIRRLAEGVLAGKSRKKKPKKNAKKKDAEKKAAEKRARGKKRKLSRIPGQKTAK
jgi:hypothetical protein